MLTEEELSELKQVFSYYEQYYKVFYVSSITNDNVETLYPIFNNKITVFAGQTGAGKSSLLNALVPNLELETNEISKKLGRGKHTTRHTELMRVGEGLIADTPGFSKLDYEHIPYDEVKNYFPEFIKYADDCKYSDCHHINEPKCNVKEHMNHILQSRYDNYIYMYNEIKQIKKKY